LAIQVAIFQPFNTISRFTSSLPMIEIVLSARRLAAANRAIANALRRTAVFEFTPNAPFRLSKRAKVSSFTVKLIWGFFDIVILA
jgi:hypothetical protein